jgi:hypothetical protein
MKAIFSDVGSQALLETVYRVLRVNGSRDAAPSTTCYEVQQSMLLFPALPMGYRNGK